MAGTMREHLKILDWWHVPTETITPLGAAPDAPSTNKIPTRDDLPGPGLEDRLARVCLTRPLAPCADQNFLLGAREGK